MQSRKEKYAKYREEIRNTPESAFVEPEHKVEKLLKEDEVLLSYADSPSRNISYGDVLPDKKGKEREYQPKDSPYETYIKRKRRAFLVKLFFFALCVAGLLLLYLLWVR